MVHISLELQKICEVNRNKLRCSRRLSMFFQVLTSTAIESMTKNLHQHSLILSIVGRIFFLKANSHLCTSKNFMEIILQTRPQKHTLVRADLNRLNLSRQTSKTSTTYRLNNISVRHGLVNLRQQVGLTNSSLIHEIVQAELDGDLASYIKREHHHTSHWWQETIQKDFGLHGI